MGEHKVIRGFARCEVMLLGLNVNHLAFQSTVKQNSVLNPVVIHLSYQFQGTGCYFALYMVPHEAIQFQ